MLILTSASPRRKSILEQIGFRENVDFKLFDVKGNFKSKLYDKMMGREDVKVRVVEAAKTKINKALDDEEISQNIEYFGKDKSVLVSADTIVYFRDRVLDRPSPIAPQNLSGEIKKEALERAKRMLLQLRGAHFSVLTGLVLTRCDRLDDLRSCCVVTEARMKNCSEDEIDQYISTGEPLDKAGGFGIQEKGVFLFEGIKGSYSNVVGLPIYELVELLQDRLFEQCVDWRTTEKYAPRDLPVVEGPPELSVVSVGDINYDVRYSGLSGDFFSNLAPPGQHIQGEIERGPGGTAVIFALKAKEEKFRRCSVLGTIGGDPIGKSIEEDLNKQWGIHTILPVNYNYETGIALILRDQSKRDILITVVEPHQMLSVEDVEKAKNEIVKADIIYISGYCLSDINRQEAASKVIEIASDHGQLLVLDVHVNMEKKLDFKDFLEITRGKVDVLVAELPTVLLWLGEPADKQNDWEFIRENVIPKFAGYRMVIFRTSTYSHEIICSSSEIIGPYELNYSSVPAEDRLGYADKRTAHTLYQLASPRILLASSSPRRLELLQQVIAKNKVEVRISNHPEEARENELPEERVRRLSKEKAQRVLEDKSYSHSIEIIVGADTEIVLDGEVLGKPKDENTARSILKKLSGKKHRVITGLTLIDAKTEQIKFNDVVSTKVEFKELSNKEIDDYIESSEPIGKAGAYGIQGKGAMFIKRIEGSYSNVVGLPLECLCEILRTQFQSSIWSFDRVSNWHIK